MQNRILGRTGVSVSPLCLGTMMFGPWGNADQADSIRIIHRALDAGINFVDTADVYSGGECERIVGKALTGRRDDVVLATKFFMPMADEPNQRGGSRRWIIRSVEDSPRRLGTDYIDRRPTHRPPTRHGHPHLQPTGWWLAVRPLAEEPCRSAYLGVPTNGAIRHDHRGQPAKARDR